MTTGKSFSHEEKLEKLDFLRTPLIPDFDRLESNSIYIFVQENQKFTIDNIFSRDACSGPRYGLNHPIIEYPKNEKSDDGQTDRQNFLSKNRTLLWKELSKKYY